MPLHSAKSVEQILDSLDMLIGARDEESTTIENLQQSGETIFNAAQNLSSYVEDNDETLNNEEIIHLVIAATGITGRIMRGAYSRRRSKLGQGQGANSNALVRDIIEYDDEDDVPRDYFFDVNGQAEDPGNDFDGEKTSNHSVMEQDIRNVR